ncbi:hypothetical protein GT755_10815 [Herbidospora sp. NEAU-GS84]|uniref:Membrane protein YmcC n=1 Tax=Herbidospora solisilvae TaxID=2696284 RepID=A0A7C9N287_9ACTN|nr:hypothetical protein [Herbidospora solisilvae]NAS22174.1 hypothetical protein [Herbidospora solisilvae]
MLWLIIAAEAGFWILLATGLLVRYGLRLRRTSWAILALTPVLDLVLLVAAVIDMRSGAVATWQHGLAGAYIAYSIVFGHRTVKWADEWVARGFRKPPKVLGEWAIWFRIAGAYTIMCLLLFGAMVMVDDPSRTSALTGFMLNALKVPLIALIWPVADSLGRQFGRKPDGDPPSPHVRPGMDGPAERSGTGPHQPDPRPARRPDADRAVDGQRDR